MSRKKTDEQFKMEFKQKGNPNVELLGQYVNQKATILARCKTCGYEWEAWPIALLRGSGCQRCAGSLRKTTKDFLEEMKTVNPNIEVLGEYKTNHVHITVRCKVCGHRWTAMPSNLLRNYGCPNCKGGVKQTKEQFESRMKKVHPDIKVLSNYIDMLQPIILKCNRCGNIWETTPNTVLNGQRSGCPACAHNQTSFLEQLLYEACKRVLGEDYVLARNRYLIGSELDIVILDKNKNPIYAIEPGSWTLHKTKVDIDEDKILQCNKIGIRLLIIYDQDSKQEVKETDNIWSYRKTFSIADDKELIKLLMRLGNFLHVEFPLSDLDEIKVIAHDRSRRMSTDDFRKQLGTKNPDIDLLGEYNGSMRKTLVRCKICGYEWNVTPQSLILLGTGCPRCHKVVRKDTAYFIDEMSKISPEITILGEYKGSKERILTKCNKCGYEWYAIPSKLLVGKGCSKCNATRSGHQKKPVRNIDTKEEYQSITSAIEATGIRQIGACCRGEQKTAGGYHWEYI